MRWGAALATTLLVFLLSFCHRLNLPPSSPELLQPENGVRGVPASVTLLWRASDPNGDPLTFEVFLGEGSEISLIATTAEDHLYVDSLKLNTEYFWKVVAVDPYGERSESPLWMFRTQAPPGKPTPVYPKDGERGVPVEAELSWESSDPDGDDVFYDVYLGEDSLVPIATSLSATSLKVRLELSRRYIWKVVAVDSYGNSSEGDTWEFETQNPPATPLPVYPRDGQSAVPISVDLSWSSSDPDGDPLEYEVTVEKDGKAVYSATTNSQSVHVDLEEGSRYTWSVKAIDVYGNSSTGGPWTFTTQHVPKVRLISPEDGQVGVDVRVKLEWEGEDEDGEKLVYDVYVGEGTPELVASSIEQSSYELELEVGKWYEWYVVVRDEAGNESESEHWRFRTQMSPSTPVLLYPEPGRENVPIEVYLRWYSFDPDGDDVSFEIYIGEGTPALVGFISTNTYHVSLDYSRTYYWKVLAKDDHGNVSESPVASFSTIQPPPPGIDEVAIFSNDSVVGIDVSDPTDPFEVWRVQVGDDVTSAFETGNELYVGTCGKIVKFVNGVETEEYDIPGCALDMIEVSGNLYVALGEDGLFRIPLSDPRSSDLLNTYSLYLDEYMGKVYVAGGEEIYVIDLATPSEVASTLDTGGFWVEKLKMVGGRVYYLVPRSGIGVLGSPGSFHPIEDILDFDVEGNLVYAVTPSQIVVVSYRTPKSHEVILEVDLTGGRAIKVVEPYVYVIGDGFYVVEFHNLKITGFEDSLVGNAFCR